MGAVRTCGSYLSAVDGDVVLTEYGSMLAFYASVCGIQHSAFDGDEVAGEDAIAGIARNGEFTAVEREIPNKDARALGDTFDVAAVLGIGIDAEDAGAVPGIDLHAAGGIVVGGLAVDM